MDLRAHSFKAFVTTSLRRWERCWMASQMKWVSDGGGRATLVVIYRNGTTEISTVGTGTVGLVCHGPAYGCTTQSYKHPSEDIMTI